MKCKGTLGRKICCFQQEQYERGVNVHERLLRPIALQLIDFRLLFCSASASEGEGDGVRITVRTVTTASSSTILGSLFVVDVVIGAPVNCYGPPPVRTQS